MTTRNVHRLRLLAGCMCLSGLAFRQDPGFVSPDTKVDLTVNPIGLLARSLHLWDPAGNFGQLQNQAYGYLWPMGPFYALTHLLGIPGWVSQRLWWALLLCVAFLGVAKLAEKLNIGTSGSRVIAGVAFALSVRTLTELGGISIEAWPSAIAPWVLVPLAGLPEGARLRRPIALSALAVACAGGVNATAVFAVVPLAVLWLLSLSTKRRFTAVVWWLVAVALATAWWVLPLVVLSRYAPPFLNFIETAEVTTRVTDVQSILRGTSHWQAYFTDIYGPVWPAGRRLATEPMLLWASAIVAAFGLAGLARRGMPHRRFLITGLLFGLAMVGFGHVMEIGGAFPEWQRNLLDHAAVAFRNVHKFDVVIRIPLALGLAHAVGVFLAAAAQRRSSDRARLRALAVTAAAMAAVLGVATPALAGGLAARGKYLSIPDYWWNATSWLDGHLNGDRVLVLPGARFGDYRWGSTGDEVIQTLLNGRWGVRDAIPLTPPGTIRYLDAIESAVDSGQGSPGLADVLARAGVRYLLVRSDIDYGKSGGPAPVVVRQALVRSPGIESVAQFGPQIGAQTTAGVFIDRGLGGPVPAIEIFEVGRPVHPVVVQDMASAQTVVGGPESLLALASAGALPDGPTILASDLATGSVAGETALTDGLRRREVNFGLGRDNTSATMDAKQPYLGTGPAPDYLPAGAGSWLTVAAYTGIAGISASSSWSDMPGLTGNRPEHSPFAAIDGDPSTSWRSAPGKPTQGQWVELRFPGPQIIKQLRITFDAAAGATPTRFTVDTGGEQVVRDGLASTSTIQLEGKLASSRLRIIVNSVVANGNGEGGVGISEIEIPGITADRYLAIPAPPIGSHVSNVVFSAATSVPACYFVDGHSICDSSRERGSEDGTVISRYFSLPASGTYQPAVWATPRPGPDLDSALAVSKFHTVSASSTATDDPTASAGAVIDGDLYSAWQPKSSDEHPWLRLTWGEERTITGLSLAMAPGIAASRPWGIQVVGHGGIRTGVVDGNGVVVFDEPLKTDEVTVFFLGAINGYSRDPYDNTVDKLPIAVGELAVLPDSPRVSPLADEQIKLPCGSGPTLRVGPLTRQTALVGTRQQLRELREVPAVLCGPVPYELNLDNGPHLLLAQASKYAVPTRVSLTAQNVAGLASADTPVQVDRWGSHDRQVTVPVYSNGRLLVVRENINPGWHAYLGSRELSRVTVDGWQQAWVIPPGVGGQIHLTFTPEMTFQIALLAGGAALGVLLLIAVLPGKRRLAQVPGRHRFRREGLYLFGGIALVAVGGLAGVALAVAGVLAFFTTRFIGRRSSEHDQVKLKRAMRVWLWLVPPGLYLFGAWLANGASDPHSALWPQFLGLGAVVALWLSAYWPLRSAARPAPIDGWSFDAVPADRRQQQAAGHGQDVHAERVAAEGRRPG